MYVDYSNKGTHLHIPAHVALGGCTQLAPGLADSRTYTGHTLHVVYRTGWANGVAYIRQAEGLL